MYGVYWDRLTPGQWREKSVKLAEERKQQLEALKAVTVAYVQPGEMQPERDFSQTGEDTSAERVLGRPGRRGRGWFSFVVPVDPATPCALRVTFFQGERRRPSFTVSADGTVLEGAPKFTPGTAEFFDHVWALPLSVTQGKKNITIRFQATGGGDIPTVFGLRLVREKGKS